MIADPKMHLTFDFWVACKAGRFQPGDGIVHAVSTTSSITGPYVDLNLSLPDSHAFSLWQLPNKTFMSFRNSKCLKLHMQSTTIRTCAKANLRVLRADVPGAQSFSVGLNRAVANTRLCEFLM